jgi:hypothetical protein
MKKCWKCWLVDVLARLFWLRGNNLDYYRLTNWFVLLHGGKDECDFVRKNNLHVQ